MPNIINKLIQQHLNFRQEFFGKSNSSIFDDLVKNGQQPQILMVACSDSRVDPAIITNAEPGELFTVRNVANIIPPYEETPGQHGTSAAVEFAVLNLGVKHVVILGHSNCGGIRSLFEESPTQNHGANFISNWMQMAHNCRNKVNHMHPDKSSADKAEICAQYSLLNSKNNLLTFPFVKDRFVNGELYIHTWYLDLLSGIIYEVDEEKNLTPLELKFIS
jgi:carbonic anhydrase